MKTTTLPPFAVQYIDLSKRRRVTYLVTLLHQWFDAQQIDLDSLRLEHVELFLDQPAGRPIRTSTRKRYRSDLRGYLAWLCKRGLVSINPPITSRRGRSLDREPTPPFVRQFVATLQPTHKKQTCRNYESRLRDLHRWMAANRIDMAQMSRQQMVQFFAHIHHRGLNAKSRQGTIIAVRVYLRWLSERALIATNPDDLVRGDDLPRLPEYLPRPIAPRDDRALLARLRASKDVDHQALLLMRNTGIRVGELITLDFSCLRTDDIGRCFLKVPLGKLDKERLVPLDDATAQLVRRLQQHGPKNRTWLLESGGGRPTSSCRYRERLRELCHELKITDHITPHRLRHTYATTLLNAGMTLLGVMRLLGHRDYRMTLRYTEITQETVGREYSEAIAKLEKIYHVESSTALDEGLDPVRTLDDVARWLRKHACTDASSTRLAKRLVRRLQRLGAQVRTLATTQVAPRR